MDREAWCAVVHGVTEGQTILSNWTELASYLWLCHSSLPAFWHSPIPTMWSFSCSPRAPTPKQKCNGITPPHKHPQWTFCRLRVFQKNIFKISALSPFSIQISFTLFSSPFASWLRATSPSPAPLGTLLQAHCIYVLSPVQQTPWTVACQEPLSMEFSRQKYHSGWSFLSPGGLPNSGAKPGSPALQLDSWLSDPSGKPTLVLSVPHNSLNVLPRPCLSVSNLYAGISFLSPRSDRIGVIFHSEGQKSSSFLGLPEPGSALSSNSTCHIKIVCSVVQSCLTLCGPVDCSPVGSSVLGASAGKNTGVGCHALLQGIFPTQGSNPHLLQFLHCKSIL